MFRRRFLLGLALLVGIASGIWFGVHAWLGQQDTRANHVQVDPPRERQTIPVPRVRFTDITEAARVRFTHFNGATGLKFLPETMGPGVAVLDYDGDGFQDLLFVNGRAWPGQRDPAGSSLTLLRNRGDGTFEDVTEAAGLNVLMYGMGLTVGDINNDGFPDIFVTGVGGNRLFLNVRGADGKRHFSDITQEAGVGGPGGWPTVSTYPEFCAWKHPIAFASSATFLDYDGDGRLDLFVCYYVTWSPAIDQAIAASRTGVGRAYLSPDHFEGTLCALYRNIDSNDKVCHFSDVSKDAGVQVISHEGTDADARPRNVGKSLGVIAFDADDDGWPDLVVANDKVRNFFFHNVPDGKGGRRFEEKGEQANIAYPEGSARAGMGVDWGEFRSGHKALVITNFANEPTTFLTPRSPRSLEFANEADAVCLSGPSRVPLKFGTFFFDFDNDGRLDLLSCNGHLEPDIESLQSSQKYRQAVQLFWNTGAQRRFEPMTEETAGPDLFKPLVGRGCAYLDLDNTGKLSVVLTENNGPARLLRNDNDLGNHWIRLTLDGDGIHSNRSALGAQITIEAGGQVMHRQVTGARGYLSQSEMPVNVGLGSATRVERITVRWPGRDVGPPQVWTDLQGDRAYRLKQGETRAEEWPKR
jgi:enediyne biosynthesis protein E4